MTSAAKTASRNKALETLGLPPGANREHIRRAFRRRALACHPDLHGGLPEMAGEFQKLTQAYRIAAETTPETIDAEFQAFAPLPGHPPTPSPAKALRGRDLHYRLRLDFTQAVLGDEVSLRYTRRTSCPACGGGPACGDEKIKTCARCAGKNLAGETAIAEVRVPPGVADGETLRVRGAGDEDPMGGPAGDLLVLISTRGHPAFRRRGLDIFSEVKLPDHRLGGGGPVRVPTVHGARRIDIPAKSTPGVMFRLPGCGVRREMGGNLEAGDHFVRLGEIKAEDYERPVSTGAKSRTVIQ